MFRRTSGRREGGTAREAGAAAIEYVMLLGFITATILFLLGLLYPNAGKSLETLVNEWGHRLATQIAGDKITKDDPNTWGVD